MISIWRFSGAPLRPVGDLVDAHHRARPPRQLDLGLLGDRAQPHHRDLVGAQIDAVVGEELGDHLVDEALVEIVAAEERVAGGAEHLVDLVLEPQDRDVERAAAEVVDRDDLAEVAGVAVGERRGGRLVEHADHGEAGDRAGGRGRRALGVVEARRHRDDRAR